MKQRAARHRDRAMMVNRLGGWGAVLYVRKRAYYWGHHYPVDALGIVRTAQVQQHKARMKERQRSGEKRSLWDLSTPAEVHADIGALVKALHEQQREVPIVLRFPS